MSEPIPQPNLPEGQEGQGPSPCQLTLVKDGQRYVFTYSPGEEGSVLEAVISMVHDPNVNLDWFDAAMLSHQLGQRLSQEMGQFHI